MVRSWKVGLIIKFDAEKDTISYNVSAEKYTYPNVLKYWDT